MSEDTLLQKLEEIRNATLLSVKEIFSVKESALYAGLSVGYVQKLCQTGRIPHFRSEGGKNIYIRKDDLVSWMTHTRCSSTAEIIERARRITNRLT